MHTERIQMDRAEATALWQKYQSHKHHQTPIDAEIERIYKLVSQGKVVVRALESIRAAGLDEKRLPKLAICRADSEGCTLRMRHNGGAEMMSTLTQWRDPRADSRRFTFPAGTFPGPVREGTYQAIVPHIPPDIRPARGLASYHILWEAEWSKRAPIDPMLLRRIGKTDFWLCLGVWDLTPVERAVIDSRARPQ